MSALHEQACEACKAGAPTVGEAERQNYLRELPEWEVVTEDGIDKLRRAYRFRNFADALAFANRVGELAEAENHHPELLTEWGRVTVTWWSHKIKGLHKTDFIMAARCDRAV